MDFVSIDRILIENVRKTLGSNHKIAKRLRNERYNFSYRLQIGSKEMFDDLTKLGLKPKKAKRLKYPTIPKKYFPDFVRGYFDGDGHVTSGMYKRSGGKGMKRVILSGFTSGTKKFLEKLKNDLIKLEVVRGGTLYYQKGYRLTFAINDSLGLYKFLYKSIGNSLYLPRKKNIFEKFIMQR